MRDAFDAVKPGHAMPGVPPRVAWPRLAGRPWAIAPARLEAVLAEIGTFGIDTGRSRLPDRAGGGPYGVTETGAAVLPVLGPLVARGDWLTTLLGATEYGAIADALTAASEDPEVRAILLELDSPGGEVSGLFDLVEEVAAIRARSGKPLWAVASDAALSAAYAIASVADRLWVTRTGEVGSIGVVAVHVDASAADAIAGLKWTLIHAGARKTDGNPHEPLSPRATADLQADVDALYGDLVTLVARNRKLDEAAVRAGDAAIYRGARALPTGLADAVGSPAQALAALVSALDAGRAPASRRAARSFSIPARTTAMSSPEADPETILAPDEDPPGTLDETPAAVPPAPDTRAIAERLRGEFAEIAAISAQAGRLGIDIDAADAMRRGLAPDALRGIVTSFRGACASARVLAFAHATPAAAFH